MKRQFSNQVVDLSGWSLDSEHPYMDGSKPKKAYFCPDSQQPDFLIPGHRYLFKRSRIPMRTPRIRHSGDESPYAQQLTH